MYNPSYDPMLSRPLTPDESFHFLKLNPNLTLFIPVPECTCCLFFQFYQCGCPDNQSHNGIGLFGKLLRFRNPTQFACLYRCPIHFLPQAAQTILHNRGFRHRNDPLLVAQAPVELPFPCYKHQEECSYRISKKAAMNIRPSLGHSNKINKLKRKQKAKREVDWAKKHRKALRAFVYEHTPFQEFNKPKVIHPADQAFIGTWDKIIRPPVHVKLESEDWFLDEQKTDLDNDDAANGSKVADIFYPEIGPLGRGKYEAGATVLDEMMITAISRNQWRRRGYPWEFVHRDRNMGEMVWSMD